MSHPAKAKSIGGAFDSIEADILPSLSVLLGSVTDSARQTNSNFDSRSAELRDMSRQIIELTRFLAAVSADASTQAENSRIRA
jgi:hypothetical protein